MISVKSCPSYIAIEQSFIIGKINQNGKTVFQEPLKATNLDIEILQNTETAPENQIRFAGRCLQKTCDQWNSKISNCQLGSFIMDSDLPESPFEDYQNCPITSSCRWLFDQGENICKKCTNVMRYMQ